MCVILLCKEKKPTDAVLEKCQTANSDGIGMAWLNKESRKATWEKNLSLYELKELVKKIELPFIIHFRNASKGGKSALLSHPLVISENSPLSFKGEADKLLFHNGTIHDWEVILAAADS